MPEFSATASALGYYYQIRYALFALLTGELNGGISLETMDDITSERDGSPVELIQTKHHVNQTASLADASPDLWKTLRNWSCKILNNEVDPNTVQLLLVSTDNITDNSVVSMLGYTPAQRYVKKALDQLQKVAEESYNKTNAKAYQDFMALTKEQRYLLLESIKVIAASPNIIDIVPKIQRQLALSTRDEFIEPVYQRLEGWWFDRAIKSMKGAESKVIFFSEVRAMINDISEQFYADNLPIDFLSCVVPEEETLADSQKVFIKQLQLVVVGQPRIRNAINDYYKAYQQRSKWVREDLVNINELENYENRLINEWQRRFLIMQENLAEGSIEHEMKLAGRNLYNEIDENINICIRPKCNEPYVMRGSYHMLANDLRIGWHAKFIERLQYLLQNAGAMQYEP
jgi:hypothetical protein